MPQRARPAAAARVSSKKTVACGRVPSCSDMTRLAPRSGMGCHCWPVLYLCMTCRLFIYELATRQFRVVYGR